MEVTRAFLADAATVSGGKVNVLGIFEVINTTEFPCVHPTMALVMRFQCNAAEYGAEKDIKIVLLDADGKSRAKLEGIVAAPVVDGPEAGFDQILGLNNLQFEKPGEYAFIVMIGGETKYRVPLRIQLIRGDTKNED